MVKSTYNKVYAYVSTLEDRDLVIAACCVEEKLGSRCFPEEFRAALIRDLLRGFEFGALDVYDPAKALARKDEASRVYARVQKALTVPVGKVWATVEKNFSGLRRSTRARVRHQLTGRLVGSPWEKEIVARVDAEEEEAKKVAENEFDFEVTPQGWLLCWRGNPDRAVRVTAVRLATVKGERRVQFLERKGSWRSVTLEEGREMLLAIGWDGESPGFKWGVQEKPAAASEAPKKDAARNEGAVALTAARPFRVPQGVTLVHFVILGEGGRRLASGNSMGVKDVDALVEEFRRKAKQLGGRLHAYWTGQEAREI